MLLHIHGGDAQVRYTPPTTSLTINLRVSLHRSHHILMYWYLNLKYTSNLYPDIYPTNYILFRLFTMDIDPNEGRSGTDRIGWHNVSNLYYTTQYIPNLYSISDFVLSTYFRSIFASTYFA